MSRAGGGAFFAKEPGDGTVVPFHQDATYWNLHHTDELAVATKLPHTVVVWLAFTDVDEHNAALQVIPGSHLHALDHVAVDHEGYVLNQAVDPDVLDSWLNPKGQQQRSRRGRNEGSNTLRLRAGEISIHDCRKQATQFYHVGSKRKQLAR